jgi:hypothetical protein
MSNEPIKSHKVFLKRRTSTFPSRTNSIYPNHYFSLLSLQLLNMFHLSTFLLGLSVLPGLISAGMSIATDKFETSSLINPALQPAGVILVLHRHFTDCTLFSY